MSKKVYKFRRYIAALIVLISICMTFNHPVRAEEKDYYTSFEFDGDDDDYNEFIHLLLAKIVYDDFEGFEGMKISDYVNAYPELYEQEIWAGSGIILSNIYNFFIGDYIIYKIFDENDKSGMYAVAFSRGHDLVLSFRGSDMIFESSILDGSNDWINTDLRFALQNELSSQFKDVDSCLYYMEEHFNLEAGLYNYTFAGHSLGGALVAYASIRTGYYGYSFDGAGGHVIDLIYSDKYLEIESFEGIDKQNFCNYTDATGYPIADLIQHTNAHAMYQIDRETELDNLNENTLIPKLAHAPSHIIWSTVTYRENVISLTDKVDADENGYTYAPYDAVRLDISKPVSEFGDTILSIFKNVFKEKLMAMLGTVTGTVMDRKLLLADSEGGKQGAFDLTMLFGGYSSGTVLYGGAGDDELTGYKYDDILIAGRGNDILDGGMGDDKYVISYNPGHITEIVDSGGVTRIMFKNMNIFSLEDIKLEDRTISLSGNQRIILNIEDTKKIKFYAYNDGRIVRLGGFDELGGD